MLQRGEDARQQTRDKFSNRSVTGSYKAHAVVVLSVRREEGAAVSPLILFACEQCAAFANFKAACERAYMRACNAIFLFFRGICEWVRSRVQCKDSMNVIFASVCLRMWVGSHLDVFLSISNEDASKVLPGFVLCERALLISWYMRLSLCVRELLIQCCVKMSLCTRERCCVCHV